MPIATSIIAIESKKLAERNIASNMDAIIIIYAMMMTGNRSFLLTLSTVCIIGEELLKRNFPI